jgi:hypothetical protein
MGWLLAYLNRMTVDSVDAVLKAAVRRKALDARFAIEPGAP